MSDGGYFDARPLGKVVRAALLASLAASTLAACAGGGGGGSPPVSPPPILPPSPPPPPTPPPPPGLPPLPAQIAPPSTFETAEYLGTNFSSGNRPGLNQIHASTAYSYGATGSGVLVAVIDTGVDTSISELTNQITEVIDIRAASRSATDIDTDGHGTMVSAVIVANKNNTGTQGVAFNAKVIGIRADTHDSCADTTPDTGGCKFSDSTLISAITLAVSKGAKIINMSLGAEGTISPQLRTAIINATNAGVLFTIAAGNEGAAASGTDPAKGQSPTEPANLAGDPAVNGRVVAVGAIDRNGAMPTFSNRAGATQAFYLLAPGVNVVMAGLDDNIRLPNNPSCSATVTMNCNDTNTDGNYWSGSGTSFASPHVAGALALMLSLFPNIAPETALNVLLITADDYITTTPDAILGVNAGAGTDQVGGRGLLNLQRAFSPIGTVSFNFGGKEVEVGQALGAASGALGDWVDHSGAFDGLVFQDMFKRGFRADSARMMPAKAAFADFTTRADYARGQSRAFAVGPAEMTWFNAPKPTYDPRTPGLEAPDANFSFSYAFSESGRVSLGRGGGPERLTPSLMLVSDASGPPVLGSGDSWTSVSQTFGPVTFDFRNSKGIDRNSSSVGFGHEDRDWAVRLGYSALADSRETLGGTFQSRFGGQDQTKMSALSVEGYRDVGAWHLSGSVEAADAHIDTLNVSGLWTSSWSLSAEHPFAGGAIRFSAAQPRRAEGGELAFNAPMEVTKTGAIIYEQRIAGLTPSGRELDFETAWVTRLGDLTTFEAAAALALQPNHVESADPEAAVWLSLRHAW